jgi:DNA invertase Pin-like site-specific DNA recombinase
MARKTFKQGEKCVLYCRTSTEKQEEGLDTQYYDGRSRISRLGLDLVIPRLEEGTFVERYPIPNDVKTKMTQMPGGWFDEGQSGGLDPMLRPAFSNMLKFMKDEDIKIIVMYHNDRLARDVELTLRVVRECKDAGIEFLFGNLPDIDIDTPEGRMLLTQLAGMGEYFRNDGKRKTQAAMHRLKGQGKYLGESPYGFYVLKKSESEEEYGTLLYDFIELDAIVRMFRHFVNSRFPSYTATANYMNEQGIKTRRGAKWTANHVRNLLTKAVLERKVSDMGQRYAEYFPEGIMEPEVNEDD